MLVLALEVRGTGNRFELQMNILRDARIYKDTVCHGYEDILHITDH